MSQNRDAPAYQEYAAAMLAKLEFRLLSLMERGLLYTMRQECWVNRRLPADPASLAVVLGQYESEVLKALPCVMPFFKQSQGFITCPELDDYRRHLEEIREKQSRGGKTGAEITNKRKRGDIGGIQESDASTPPSELPGKSLDDPPW